MKPEVLRHCMFTTYARSNISKTEDAVIIKERLRCPKTGREKPNLRLVRNPTRPYGVTKKEFRSEHQQKKDVEKVSKLDIAHCTQAELPFRIARALGQQGQGFLPVSKLARSPYLYGTDIHVTVLEKAKHDKRNAKVNGSWVPDYSIAVMDFETNMHSAAQEIISGAITYKNKAVIAVTEEFVKSVPDIETKVHTMAQKYLKEDIEARDIKIKLEIVKNDYEVAKVCMKYAHAWAPDFLAFWNMNFDIKKIIQSCERHDKDPAFLFSDPRIPKEFRFFRYKEDEVNRITASGKKMNKDPSDTWNVVNAPASFYVIDGMSVFRLLRIIKGKRHSYSLDATLESELGIRKLEIPGVEGNHNISWHRKMQKNFKAEYLVYNMFDCVSVELLDEKTKDLRTKIALYADGSDLASISSNPKRLANAIHLYLEDKNLMLCSTSDNMTEVEFDHKVLDKQHWIVTLANELADESGIALFEELPDFIIRAAIGVSDIDITSGYPTTQLVGNISKGTTLAEIFGVQGLNKNQIKNLAVNIVNAPANAVVIGTGLLKMPELDHWVEEYDELYKEAA